MQSKEKREKSLKSSDEESLYSNESVVCRVRVGRGGVKSYKDLVYCKREMREKSVRTAWENALITRTLLVILLCKCAGIMRK